MGLSSSRTACDAVSKEKERARDREEGGGENLERITGYTYLSVIFSDEHGGPHHTPLTVCLHEIDAHVHRCRDDQQDPPRPPACGKLRAPVVATTRLWQKGEILIPGSGISRHQACGACTSCVHGVVRDRHDACRVQQSFSRNQRKAEEKPIICFSFGLEKGNETPRQR